MRRVRNLRLLVQIPGCRSREVVGKKYRWISEVGFPISVQYTTPFGHNSRTWPTNDVKTLSIAICICLSLCERGAKINNLNSTTSIFFQSILRWSVAVSTICRHSSRVVVFLQAVARPKFIAQSRVWLGLPVGRFQSGGKLTCRIHAARSRWWSSRGELQLLLKRINLCI